MARPVCIEQCRAMNDVDTLKKEYLIICLTEFANNFISHQERRMMREMMRGMRDIRMARELARSLYQKNMELEKFKEITIGRELKMIELKYHVKKLEEEAAPSSATVER